MAKKTPIPKEILKKQTHPKLQVVLWVYFLIAIIFLGLAIWHVFWDDVRGWLIFGPLALGLIIGAIISRIAKISWDLQTRQVISKIDILGLGVLLAYLIFCWWRQRLIAQFVHGPEITTVTFSLLSGIMYGRMLGVRGKIKKVIRKKEKSVIYIKKK